MNKIINISGYCNECQVVHVLDSSGAVNSCLELMDTLDRERRIDFTVGVEASEAVYSTDYLFGQARGQMFGVMVYEEGEGCQGTARAFSGQYNGRWSAPGWVDPVIDEAEFFDLTSATERRIKQIGRDMESAGAVSDQYRQLSVERKEISRDLMRKIHAIYRVRNFLGEVRSMPEIALSCGGLPTGTGDCCAPKLLNYAALNGFRPISIAEFFYGVPNRSGRRQHRQFYSSCPDKCGLILGFMLCGL
ncbi:hypothetical protein [Maridesulfovibrio sp. FT414]|uniref:hypothetical protein n=1 Tax=Maridesulfovibrio sp. FT414 TaxID=2979469 RepID=UPI003D805334